MKVCLVFGVYVVSETKNSNQIHEKASRAQLSRAQLSRAQLSRAQLSRAQLSRAQLSRAQLSRHHDAPFQSSGDKFFFQIDLQKICYYNRNKQLKKIGNEHLASH